MSKDAEFQSSFNKSLEPEVETSGLPLSPVLGSGQNIRRIVKKRKKEKHNVSLVQKQETDLKESFETSEAEPEQSYYPGFNVLDNSKKDISISSQSCINEENILFKIRNLEKLEHQRKLIVQQMSKRQNSSFQANNKLQETVQKTIFNKNSNSNNVFKIDSMQGFVTGRGKSLDISSTALEESKKLFNDILDPLKNHTRRENKYNYLSKSSLHNSSVNKSGNFQKDLTPILESPKQSGFMINEKMSPINERHEIDLNNLNVSPTNNINNALTKEQKYPKLFVDKHIPDVELKKSDCFKRLSNNNMTKKISSDKTLKKKTSYVLINIFENEDFSDLNLNKDSICGFNSALHSLGPQALQDSKLEFNKQEFVHTLTHGDTKANSKNLKNIFNEDFSDLNWKEQSCAGFKSASDNLDPINLQKVKSISMEQKDKLVDKPMFKNIFEGETFSDLISNSNCGFISALEYPKDQPLICDPTPNSCSNGDNGYMEANSPENSNANKTIIDLRDNTKITRKIFEREVFDDLDISEICYGRKDLLPKKPALSIPFISPILTSNKVQGELENFVGFSVVTQQLSQNISNDYFKLLEVLKKRNSESLHSSLNDLSNSINNNKQSLNNELIRITSKKRAFSEMNTSNNTFTPVAKRKRLGAKFPSTIRVSQAGLSKAKQLFKDILPQPLETSTPLKSANNASKPVTCELTPIPAYLKNSSRLNLSYSQPVEVTEYSIIDTIHKLTLNKPTEGDLSTWINNLDNERRILEEKLRIINEKQDILVSQKNMLDQSGKVKARIIPGVLLKSKTNRKTVNLREFVIERNTELSHNDNVLGQINPENAHLIHFSVADKSTSHIKTLDGAIIVPNTDHKVGLSEIEHSFTVMDGVDLNLIPNGWIRNHFKWIVWKLASYDRIFVRKQCTLESLGIENIVQQLKYRYDIEIDQAQRSVLRKILEMDESPQKRMVLCVSKIAKTNFNTYELELTDGWYAIRTVIDHLLCDQVTKGKIKLGTKLMIYGAEIVNCQGCDPLEAPENVYLKINYNATRRAVWWCKLGCQKFSGPFLIPMSSIHLAGGKIGCIKCYILRIYPIKYLEKCGNENVWRNEKAEERQAEAYQNACSSNTRSKNQETVRDIKNITNPEQLYDMLQQTQDVESFQEIMSATQKSAVYQYSICKSFNNSKSVQSRNVTPVLKMKISNVEGEPAKILDFFVWRPTEEHLLELREHEVVTIYDLSCSGKWGLSANKTTIFRRDKKPKDDALKKFTRKVTSISRLTTFSRDSCLNEFDTVGLVVKKMIREDLQQVWMTDTHQSLLLVRITEGPKTILVLDNVTEGEAISVCNLQFKHAYKTHTVSEGDHFITFSKYPKYLHLKDALEVLNTEFATLKKDELIQKCLDKISNLDVNGDNKQIQSPLDTDEMESSQITSTDIALLECIDRII